MYHNISRIIIPDMAGHGCFKPNACDFEHLVDNGGIFFYNETLYIIMPPGTIVPMGAYCFYCVRMYVCMYVCMSEFG